MQEAEPPVVEGGAAVAVGMVQNVFCTLPSAKDIKSKGTVIERRVAKCLSFFHSLVYNSFFATKYSCKKKKEYIKMIMKKFLRAKS